MKVIRAAHLGMCFGVRDAIALALETAKEKSLTILGELVHNETVLSSLRSKGIKFEHEVEQVNTPMAMITAHGASERAINRARGRGLNIIEATCPLVHFAHSSVAKLVRAGYYPVIIGKRDHVCWSDDL
jgi:4-hydroxy-3-methylbut-2-enyl diphosphate reductase